MNILYNFPDNYLVVAVNMKINPIIPNANGSIIFLVFSLSLSLIQHLNALPNIKTPNAANIMKNGCK